MKARAKKRSKLRCAVLLRIFPIPRPACGFVVVYNRDMLRCCLRGRTREGLESRSSSARDVRV
jgi:hypothetical protein